MPDVVASGSRLAPVAAKKHSAEDFRQLKMLLRLLEERIAKETPKARKLCPSVRDLRARLLTETLMTP